jgi:hypothetical protein
LAPILPPNLLHAPTHHETKKHISSNNNISTPS